MTRGGRLSRMAGAAVGLVAAGAAAGTLLDRRVAGLASVPPSYGGVPLGSLRGEPRTVTTPDGVELHVETDEPDAAAGADGVPTVVLVHGYSLNLDCWHLQRLALRGRVRLVCYDQRSHGRSTRAGRHRSTIEQLGADLRQVLEEVVPEGPIVLVGHSMGGMAILALAQQAPDYVARRVHAVALISTSAGDLGAVPLGLPGLPGRVARRLAPGALAMAARAPHLVESGRRVGSSVGYLLTARYGFGDQADPELVAFADDMLSATPLSVVADFFPDVSMHDRYAALAALRQVRTLVLCGTEDHITPVEHSRLLAERLPAARLHELAGAGHLVILERPDEVNEALVALLDPADRAEAP